MTDPLEELSQIRFSFCGSFLGWDGRCQGQYVGQLAGAGGGRQGRAAEVLVSLLFDGGEGSTTANFVEFGKVFVQIAGSGDRVGHGVAFGELLGMK